jgi:hypothetical protein
VPPTSLRPTTVINGRTNLASRADSGVSTARVRDPFGWADADRERWTHIESDRVEVSSLPVTEPHQSGPPRRQPMNRYELTIDRDIDRDGRRWMRRPNEASDHEARTVATDSRRPVFGFCLAMLG